MSFRVELSNSTYLIVDDQGRNAILKTLGTGTPIDNRPTIEIDDKGGKGKVIVAVAHIVAIRSNNS